MKLKGKVALVTGATSGIGKATALAFANAGAKAVFSGRRDQEGEETAALKGIRINAVNPGIIPPP